MEELESASNLLKSTQLMSFREDLNAHLLKLDICLPRAVFEEKKKVLTKVRTAGNHTKGDSTPNADCSY